MPDDYQIPQGIWKAIFEFAQNLGANDAVNQGNVTSTYQQMSEEVLWSFRSNFVVKFLFWRWFIQNRKWLEEALSSYAKDSDPVRLMKTNIELLMSFDLHGPNEEEVEKGVAALQVLNDLCTNLDVATGTPSRLVSLQY